MWWDLQNSSQARSMLHSLGNLQQIPTAHSFLNHRSFVGSNVCLEFVYSGCGTSENVFGAEKECRQMCGDRKGDDDYYSMGDGDVYLI